MEPIDATMYISMEYIIYIMCVCVCIYTKDLSYAYTTSSVIGCLIVNFVKT